MRMPVRGRALIVGLLLALVAWPLGFSRLGTSAVWAQPTALDASCPGEAFAVAHVPGGDSPYIKLRAGEVEGMFLIDYAASASSVSQAAFGAEGGTPRRLSFNLRSFDTGLFQVRPYFFKAQPPGGVIGVVGTDFLSLLSARFQRDTMFISAAPCPAADGFTSISQIGYFTSKPAPGASNIPVVYVGIGDTHVVAQFDTGYDGLSDRASVDINQPLLDRLIARGVKLKRLPDLTMSTCVGSEVRRVYEAPDLPLVVENERGAPIVEVRNYRMLLKPRNSCGGIAGWNIPAAQLDATFLKRFEEVIFDPRGEKVWIKRASPRS